MAHPDPKEASELGDPGWRGLCTTTSAPLLCQHSAPLLFIPLFFSTSSPFPPPHQASTSPLYHHQQNYAHFEQPQTSPTSPTLAAHLFVLLCASPHQPFSSDADLLGTGMVIYLDAAL